MVVVLLEVDEKFRSLEVSTSDANIVLPTGMVELREAPINQSKLALLVVDHDVVRLDVSVHDAVRVAVVQGLEELENVIANVVVGEGGVEYLEVRVIDVLEDEGGGFGLRVADHIEELNYVLPTAHVLGERGRSEARQKVVSYKCCVVLRATRAKMRVALCFPTPASLAAALHLTPPPLT